VHLVSKISNLCDPDPPASQTDGRHAFSMPCYALVHRAVKTDIKNANTIRYRYRAISSVAYLFLAGKWIYIRHSYNSNIEIERNGMNGMTTRLFRFTLTYKYFPK